MQNIKYLGITLAADVVFDFGEKCTVKFEFVETGTNVAHFE